MNSNNTPKRTGGVDVDTAGLLRGITMPERIVTPTTIDNNGETTEQTSVGVIDVARLRLSQDFASNVGVKRALLTVPVRKPDRQSFVRVHPDPTYRLQTAVLELKEDREVYLVDPALWNELPGEFVPVELFTAISRQGVLFLWPVRLPAEDGRQLEWHRSAAEAAEMAIRFWIKVVANMALGAYEVFQATGNLPEPEWPEKSFGELLQIAFKGRFITDMDHVVLRRLRGDQ
ncbi:MAG TPA: hypothetical protein PKY77_25900 [Phycisphaerae bacterium]|nr:hypothetical protein [Phycisphaerae bacterium]HRY66848.1 hypothetical protein [Phycisphaerae bacterium]HSA26906.1 hypothetical protein [Phycisphaerae bacterium]